MSLQQQVGLWLFRVFFIWTSLPFDLTVEFPSDKPVTTDCLATKFSPYLGRYDHIQNALCLTNTAKEVKVAGLGTTQTGYVIRFKDEQSFATL
jgi:hypothetical protein